MSRFIDLSHEIADGLTTYPGLAAPQILSAMTFDDSHSHYADGYEFEISRIDMVANTGTYIDSPAHRVRGGADLADFGLSQVAGLDVVVVSTQDITIDPGLLEDKDIAGRAVLFHTGWSRHWATPAYGQGHPHLAEPTAARLVERGAALVGIDSLNVDGTSDGRRPIHSSLLMAGIPILEHLTNLDQLPPTGATLFAVPPKVRGMGSFPVRAFCMVD
ncbi:MAG: cyclase family protein [bacterium]|nr:cyclase family protein [bacterium]